MRIAVVIPCYNGEDYVEEALLSVLSQTRKPDEIIVSDDNSNDNTVSICKKYSDKIKIFQNAAGPSGFVNGWNTAIKYAECEFVTILHQDDLLEPTFLEEVEKAHSLFPEAKHIFASYYSIGEDSNNKQLLTGEFLDNKAHLYSGTEYSKLYMFTPNHIHRCPGVVTHKDIFKDCQYREEAGHITDDDFFMRVGNYTDVVGILKPLACYREHHKSESGHLRLADLFLRLIKDYDYQLRHFNENPILTNEFKAFFIKTKRNLSIKVIGYSLIKFKFNYIPKVLKYYF